MGHYAKRFFGKGGIPRDGLVAEYLFNGNALDTSGNGYNGTVTGATLTTDRKGVSNSAYLFNGTSSYIIIPPNFTFLTGRSISLWANFWNCTTICYFLGSGGNGCRYNGTNFLTNIGQGVINLLNWTKVNRQVNVVIIRTLPNNFDYYIDGNFIGSQSTGTVVTDINIQYISSLVGTFYFFNGTLDDIRFYDRVLTQIEITQLYNE